MRKLTYLVLALAAIYSGYWVIGSTALSKGIDTQISAMQTDGWTIETTDLSTSGFPSRFDTSATDLTVATPTKGLIWRAPFVQVNSLSYKPNAVILALPNHQELEINGEPYQIASDGLKASAAVSANPALDLTNLTIETGPLSVDGQLGPLASLTNGIAALRPAGPTPNTYDVYADLDDLTLPEDLRKLLDPRGTFPVAFTQATLDANVTIDRTLDRHALTLGELPLIDGFTLNGMTLTWGPVELFASGALTIDSAGIPTGTLTLKARNWLQLLDMSVRIGAIDPSFVSTFKTMALIMSGGASDISVPVSFENGQMMIGTVPAGAAPRFR